MTDMSTRPVMKTRDGSSSGQRDDRGRFVTVQVAGSTAADMETKALRQAREVFGSTGSLTVVLLDIRTSIQMESDPCFAKITIQHEPDPLIKLNTPRFSGATFDDIEIQAIAWGQNAFGPGYDVTLDSFSNASYLDGEMTSYAYVAGTKKVS